MSDNSHQMTTRSKANEIHSEEIIYESSDMTSDDESVDENGNLKGFIDYDCKDDFDHQYRTQKGYKVSVKSIDLNQDFEKISEDLKMVIV